MKLKKQKCAVCGEIKDLIQFPTHPFKNLKVCNCCYIKLMQQQIREIIIKNKNNY